LHMQSCFIITCQSFMLMCIVLMFDASMSTSMFLILFHLCKMLQCQCHC
jgi:hypothetical protein